MPYQLLDSAEVVRVYSPTLVAEQLLCTFVSQPSGSVLILTIDPADFTGGTASLLLEGLSDAVEHLLSDPSVTAAAGTQALDDSNLIYDAVTFTVVYTPPGGTPGEISATVDIPVSVITADTAFQNFLAGGSATDRLAAVYNNLKQLAGD